MDQLLHTVPSQIRRSDEGAVSIEPCPDAILDLEVVFAVDIGSFDICAAAIFRAAQENNICWNLFIILNTYYGTHFNIAPSNITEIIV